MIDGADTRKAKWEREVLEPTLKKAPERSGPFTTISGRPIERLYTAEDVAGIDYDRDIANPGDYVVTELGVESIVLTRAEDGSVNAFYNVCSHRGSTVCREPRGNARACPHTRDDP